MNQHGEDHHDQESEYDSMSSAPGTPRNSEGNGEKRKKSRGLKKLFTRKNSGLDKSASGKGLIGDEAGGSESRRRSLKSFLKFGGRTPKKGDGNTSETSSEKNARDNRVEASKEETKPKLETLAEKLGEETEAKVDDKGKEKEHQEPELKHDHHHHHKQDEHLHDDVKEEKTEATESEAVTEEGGDMISPPLHVKESHGCESLAKGLQHLCLPWTIKKEDH